MALIVEDGTGMADANSYESVENADAYFTARGITAWSGSDPVKEAALIAATEYVDIRWRGKLKGKLQFPDTQVLLFPRINVYDEELRLLTGVPKDLRSAVCEYALISLTQTLMPNQPVISSDVGKILMEETKQVGPIRKSKKYQIGSAFQSFSKPDMLMSTFIVAYAGQATAYV